MRSLETGIRFRRNVWEVLPTAAVLAASLGGCGHGQLSRGSDPRAQLAQACSTGAAVKSAKGSVWLKAKSKEASGQFPAIVDAPTPDRLQMEVTNLVGGTEAIIRVEGRSYKIEVPNRKDRSESGQASWGGIPLQWANALFLGRIPCPDAEMIRDAAVSAGGGNELVVETPATLDRRPEKYVYRLRQVEGASWPEALHWERQGIAGSSPIAVDFKFEEPESKTRSPKKWEAKGIQGEVKVRWRDRQTEMSR